MNHDILIVLPVCYLDIDLCEQLIDNIASLDDYINTDVLLVFKVIDKNIDIKKINNIKTKLDKLFKSVALIYCEEPKQLPWSMSVSNTFTNVMRYLLFINNDRPFYFMESDNTIIKPGWYELIRKEYFSENHKFLGNIATINPYYQPKYGTTTLVGGAIYPANFIEYIGDIVHIDFNQSNIDDYYSGPFGLCISKHVLNDSKQSRHMQNLWGSSKFNKITKTNYECYKSNTVRQIEINNDIAIFHGCKDGSLLRCLKNEI